MRHCVAGYRADCGAADVKGAGAAKKGMVVLLLAVAGLHVSQHLLRAVVADSAAAASPEAARAAFDLLSTVCRAVHNVAPALRPDGSVGAGAQSGLLIRNDSADLLRLLDAAAGNARTVSGDAGAAQNGLRSKGGGAVQLEVRLFATLRAFAPADAVAGVFSANCPEGTTVDSLAERLGIEAAKVHMRMVNGVGVDGTHVLKERDRVGLFPPVGGG